MESRKRNKTVERPVAVPPWAAQIEVVARDGYLIVTGRDPAVDVISKEVNAFDRQPDLLKNFFEFVNANGNGAHPLHMLFASAKTDEALVAFVQRYGPVRAKKYRPALDAFVADQTMDGLRRERDLFYAAVMLLKAVRDTRESARRILEMYGDLAKATEGKAPIRNLQRDRDHVENFTRRSMAQFRILRNRVAKFGIALVRVGGFEQDPLGKNAPDPYEAEMAWNYFRKGNVLGVFWAANHLLCRLVSIFPTQLVFGGHEVLEMPIVTPYGVRPILYFMLREEYRRNREIQVCERPECGKTFVVERSGARFCGAQCSKLQRQREYWRNAGKSRRKTRSERKAQRVLD